MSDSESAEIEISAASIESEVATPEDSNDQLDNLKDPLSPDEATGPAFAPFAKPPLGETKGPGALAPMKLPPPVGLGNESTVNSNDTNDSDSDRAIAQPPLLSQSAEPPQAASSPEPPSTPESRPPRDSPFSMQPMRPSPPLSTPKSDQDTQQSGQNSSPGDEAGAQTSRTKSSNLNNTKSSSGEDSKRGRERMRDCCCPCCGGCEDCGGCTCCGDCLCCDCCDFCDCCQAYDFSAMRSACESDSELGVTTYCSGCQSCHCEC